MTRGLELLLGLLAVQIAMVGVAHGFAPGPLLAAVGTSALGLTALAVATRVLVKLVAPHLGEERSWRGLARALPGLEVQTFGGQEPPRGHLWLGPTRVTLRPADHTFLVHVHRVAPDAPPDWRLDPTPGGTTGDPDLDARVTIHGPPEAVAAALTPALRGRILTWVGGGVRIRGAHATFEAPRLLKAPDDSAARIQAVADLLARLARAPTGPEALEIAARSDPEPGVRAVALRTLLATYPMTSVHRALAREALEAAHPPLRRAAAEALFAPEADLVAARRLLAESLAEGDPAEQAHAVGLIFDALPARQARRLLRLGLARGEGPLAPEVLARVDAGLQDALLDRLERCESEALVALVPALAEHQQQAALLALARHRHAEVSVPALQALAACGTLEAVAPLLAVARSAWAPSRRGAALQVARHLQAVHGVPARGALSTTPEDGAGRLSDA